LVDSIESYKELNLGGGPPDYLCFMLLFAGRNEIY